ncbi:MAG: class I mannose-6-phosphate isomerase [Bacteroidota bacterium]|nr:class I mannose-6-phosphate isomerase [Bacteroidota bacterium]
MNKLVDDFKIIADDFRNTEQQHLPLVNESGKKNGYDIYPSFKIAGPVFQGFDSLAERIIAYEQNIVIDGYGGVLWEVFTDQLNNHFVQKGINVNWIDINKALMPAGHIREMIAPFMGGTDPLFGSLYTGQLKDFFDPTILGSLAPCDGVLNILYGTGAALAGWKGAVIYLDVPKNEIQFRSRAGKVCNIGEVCPEDPKIQYKRFYFIDWQVLNKHKQQLLPEIDVIVDEQRITKISWTTGQNLRDALNKMSVNVLRARPWFEPGVWGGQWLKKHVKGLNYDVPNYAWSFELIAPENGIIIEHDNIMLEISFDFLLFNNNKAILGKAAERFGYNFPIRFDFLDTMAGGNLSLQCHPSVAFTKANFGEDFTQDETYYILEAEADAAVYLGFQEGIDPEKFKSVLENSARLSIPVNIEEYVQKFPSKKHDLFLIPNGTVHGSGRNNMVLEISATPYIFTFKMYDWLRPDLNGIPRPLNIGRAFENLNFERSGSVVSKTLISEQSPVALGSDWSIISLPTHSEHFYAIQRFEFDTEIEAETNGQCHILNLVEGDCIIVRTGEVEQLVYFAETFIIPAGAKTYSMRNAGAVKAKVICAFVKDDHNKTKTLLF